MIFDNGITSVPNGEVTPNLVFPIGRPIVVALDFSTFDQSIIILISIIIFCLGKGNFPAGFSSFIPGGHHNYSAVIFPDHLPEVWSGILERSLSTNIRSSLLESVAI